MGELEPRTVICAIGDVHGHMQLALCVAARWQQALGVEFDAVLLAGDIAAYADEGRLDQATRRHAELNGCELELLRQWMTDPPAPWLEGIFTSFAEGGLGLSCPVVMVSGNHEDFEHLAAITPLQEPPFPVAVRDLPRVDPARRFSFLPSGWRCRTDGGITIAGIGGLDRSQRSGYVEGAYIDEVDVLAIEEGPRVDVLLTHTGPERIQGPRRGAPSLDRLPGMAKVWFHGHSIANDAFQQVAGTTIVPLHGVPFDPRRTRPNDPGRDAWCVARLGGEQMELDRLGPDPTHPDQSVWYEFQRSRWTVPRDRRGRLLPGFEDQLIAPPLVAWSSR